MPIRARVRLVTYFDRKEQQLNTINAEYKMLSAKVRFIGLHQQEAGGDEQKGA
jgi:hypothetical protein